MSMLEPWQLFLWIVGLEIVSVPILVAGIRAMIDGYFKAKEQHQLKLIGSLGKTLEALGKDLAKIKEDSKDVN